LVTVIRYLFALVPVWLIVIDFCTFTAHVYVLHAFYTLLHTTGYGCWLRYTRLRSHHVTHTVTTHVTRFTFPTRSHYTCVYRLPFGYTLYVRSRLVTFWITTGCGWIVPAFAFTRCTAVCTFVCLVVDSVTGCVSLLVGCWLPPRTTFTARLRLRWMRVYVYGYTRLDFIPRITYRWLPRFTRYRYARLVTRLPRTRAHTHAVRLRWVTLIAVYTRWLRLPHVYVDYTFAGLPHVDFTPHVPRLLPTGYTLRFTTLHTFPVTLRLLRLRLLRLHVHLFTVVGLHLPLRTTLLPHVTFTVTHVYVCVLRLRLRCSGYVYIYTHTFTTLRLVTFYRLPRIYVAHGWLVTFTFG